MAKKKQKESKLERLLQIAQVMNMMNAPGQQQAQLAQQGQGQKIQALLGMLGLMQGDENADADRAVRQQEGQEGRSLQREGMSLQREEGAAGRQHMSAEAALSRALQASEGKAGRDLTSSEAQMSRDQALKFFGEEMGFKKEVAGKEDAYRDKSLNQNRELGEKQLDLTGKGNMMDFIGRFAGMPGMNLETMMKGSGDPTMQSMAELLSAAALKEKVDKARPEIVGAKTSENRRLNFSQLPPDVQEVLAPAMSTPMFGESQSPHLPPTTFQPDMSWNPAAPVESIPPLPKKPLVSALEQLFSGQSLIK